MNLFSQTSRQQAILSQSSFNFQPSTTRQLRQLVNRSVINQRVHLNDSVARLNLQRPSVGAQNIHVAQSNVQAKSEFCKSQTIMSISHIFEEEQKLKKLEIMKNILKRLPAKL